MDSNSPQPVRILTRVQQGRGQWWLLHRWALALLLAGLLVRGAIAVALPAGFDEAYYYVYTLHPSWSYFDHPLLVAITTGLGPWLLGWVSPFSIRLGSLLLHTLTLWLLYLTGDRLFSRPTGLFALAIATASPIFQLGFGTLTLPDCPLMFFWTACLYCVSHEFFSRDRPYQPTYRLAIASALVGLACLGKYHGVALGFGLILFCVLSPPHRLALRSGWMVLGVGLFAIAIAPLLLWNAQHGWASFVFQSSRAVSDAPYLFGSLTIAWLLGIAYLFPTIGFPMWWTIGTCSLAIAAGWWGRVVPRRGQQLLLLCVSLPPLLVFTWMGGYRAILPTWPMPGFWGIAILLGAQASTWWQQAPRAVWIWLSTTGLTASFLMVLAALHVNAGIMQTPSTRALFGGWIPVERDASTQQLDIGQVRRGIAESALLTAALEEAEFVATGEWFLSGYVAMAIAPLGDVPVTCLGSDRRGFDYWYEPDRWVGSSGLYLETQRFGKLSSLPPSSYQSADAIGQIELQRGGEPVDTVTIYRLVVRSPDPS